MTHNTKLPLDKAELLSVTLEALLYGFSLLMFGGTIWTLLSSGSPSGRQVNVKMLTVACALLLCSTAHVAIHTFRVVEGFIYHRDTYPGGTIAYFADVSQWPFNFNNGIYVVQTLIADGVILYRCYVVWRSLLVMIFPVLLWCSTGLVGFMACYTSSKGSKTGIFGGASAPWITAYWGVSLSTNLLATLLLVSRLWYVDRNATKLRASVSNLRPILQITIDAGALYTLTLVMALICFVSKTNVQTVVLDMIMPVIAIAFYMVIIRVGMASRSRSASMSLGSSMDHSLSTERRRRLQVHVMTLTESKADNGQPSPLGLTNSVGNRGSPREVKYDDEEGV